MPIESHVAEIKKNCKMCNTYRLRKPGDLSAKTQVQKDLFELQTRFSNRQQFLRRTEDANANQSQMAQDNRFYCRDLIDECKACDRSVDAINRKIGKLKPLSE
ncbi:MAG: hypothetical protein V1777_00355 [Candidatus Micrarchaeota archaeon]